MFIAALYLLSLPRLKLSFCNTTGFSLTMSVYFYTVASAEICKAGEFSREAKNNGKCMLVIWIVLNIFSFEAV